jgi:hypothetical protein
VLNKVIKGLRRLDGRVLRSLSVAVLPGFGGRGLLLLLLLLAMCVGRWLLRWWLSR